MTYRGRVKNGLVTLDEPVELPEGVAVKVEVIEDAEGQPTIWNKLLELAGNVEGLPPDAARNHDHYLYGTRKEQ
ncbi:MAG TPA: hypothetical protein VHX86_05720 [Tepidisphaeraceae bacterium]|jgi:hypothetical protein|nr:hypothetical protein [Tepidisphaeraceae bacterium]